MHKNTRLAERIRHTAYFLWEQDGCPEGQAMDYWLRAKEIHQGQSANEMWEPEVVAPDDAANQPYNAANTFNSK